MTREEAYKYFEIEFDGEYDWMPDMTELQFKTFIDKVYDSFEATIEAKEIIIKDTSAIMEDMAQPKTCYGCKHIEIHIYRAHKTATCTNKKCNEMYYCDVGSDFCCNYYEPKAQYE